MITCAKIRYKTRAVAQDIKAELVGAKHFGPSQKKSPHKLRPYFCKYCGWWHLTAIKKTSQRSIDRRRKRNYEKRNQNQEA